MDVRGQLLGAQRWIAAQLFEGFRTALAPHIEGTSAPDLALSDDDVRDCYTPRRRLNSMAEALFALTSYDGGWKGLQYGHSTLVFPGELIGELSLSIGYPARGQGGYDLKGTFGALVPVRTLNSVRIEPNGDRKEIASPYRETFSFPLEYRFCEAASFRLLRAIHMAAAQWEISARVEEYSDV